MDKKNIIALMRSDIKKHQKGEIDCLPTISQYAKQANLTAEAIAKHLRSLTEKEQAYCYSHEDEIED